MKVKNAFEIEALIEEGKLKEVEKELLPVLKLVNKFDWDAIRGHFSEPLVCSDALTKINGYCSFLQTIATKMNTERDKQTAKHSSKKIKEHRDLGGSVKLATIREEILPKVIKYVELAEKLNGYVDKMKRTISVLQTKLNYFRIIP